jgi:hypothetical protein
MLQPHWSGALYQPALRLCATAPLAAQLQPHPVKTKDPTGMAAEDVGSARH